MSAVISSIPYYHNILIVKWCYGITVIDMGNLRPFRRVSENCADRGQLTKHASKEAVSENVAGIQGNTDRKPATCGETKIPSWLICLEDEYQLDVAYFPDRITLRASINKARFKDLCFKLRIHGFAYMPDLRAFVRGV